MGALQRLGTKKVKKEDITKCCYCGDLTVKTDDFKVGKNEYVCHKCYIIEVKRGIWKRHGRSQDYSRG